MGKKMTRIIAGLLFACMIAGSIPANAVYGNDANVDNEQSQNQNLSENEQNIGSTDGGEDSVFENGEIQAQSDENDTVSAAESSEVNADAGTAAGDETESAGATETGGSENTEAGEISFVYVESPYLETPGTQRIVFAFDQALSKTDKITLTVKDDAGNQEEWDLSRQTDYLYLFEKEYTGDAYSGTYQAVSLNLYGEKDENIILEEAGVKAEFGVNEEYDGLEDLQPIEETAEDTSGVEASVVTIDEDGIAEAQDSIADALNTVSAQTAANGISTFSTDTTSRSGNIVVALDPGHDEWDAGARGNGLAEEELTLKIANYCKEELEQYSGVTVYMTRTGPECPHDIWGVGCIPERVEAAAAAGAQIFVSFHLNAATSSSANGAEVIVPNESWQAEVGQDGRELGEAILDELVSLGLTRRSVYSKNTTIGETYPDGSISDYFGVQIYCKEAGIPGLIVEHAFISNSGDANKFLKTEAGLKSLGVADATGIAKYLGLSKGYWDGEYYYTNGQKVKGEYCIGGKWYYFDETSGKLQLGFQKLGNRTVYYTRENGMAFGEQSVNGKWYFFNPGDGNLKLGFQDVGSRTVYYTREDGMLFGEQCIEGKWYYFDSGNGNLKLGFQKVGNRTVYYTREDGMIYGIQTIGDKTYWFDEKNGNVKLGFQVLDGKTVYFTLEDGKILGEYCIDGKWYYFDSISGELKLGFQKVGKRTAYYTREDGMLFGEQCIEDKWYYFDSGNGNLKLGFQEVGSRIVYYTYEEGMLFGEHIVDGKQYLFDKVNGNLKLGFQEIDGKTAYYTKEEGKVFGEQCIDGKWYYFNPNNGNLELGFQNVGTRTVYYTREGGMLFGEQCIDDKWHYFDLSNGNLKLGFQKVGNRTVYYTKEQGMIYGPFIVDGKNYYFSESNGNMVRSAWVNGKYYDENGVERISSLTPIMGSSQTTVTQMENYYQMNGKTYPEFYQKSDAPTLKDFCTIYYEEAVAQGIRPEVAFAQAMKETAWLQYGGDVKIEQYNFAGLGAVGGGASGASFSSVREGIRAQIQHLFAYAADEGESGLVYPCVDGRFKYVNPKGGAEYVEWLGKQENPTPGYGWATAPNYGTSIVRMISDLLKCPQ